MIHIVDKACCFETETFLVLAHLTPFSLKEEKAHRNRLGGYVSFENITSMFINKASIVLAHEKQSIIKTTLHIF